MEALNNLGSVYQELGRFADAEAEFEKVLSLNPDYPKAHHNLGNTFLKQNQVDEAITSYKQALAYQANYKIVEFHLANALLLKGDFQSGWPLYEFREEAKLTKDERREFPRPMWDASPLGDKTILLHSEQGIGDTIQFVRYARIVAGYGGRVVLECQATCKKLMETIPEISAVFEKEEELPDFDVHAPLMSLPYLFGTTLETIPCDIPYIRPPEAQAVPDEFHSAEGTLKVGLVWAGNPEHPNDKNRSISLEKFEQILDTNKIRFFSLQVGKRNTDIKRLQFQDTLKNLGGELIDFSTTAAVMAHLDLIISVDTAPAHLAGAMGKAVWTLLPYAPDWRWMLNRSDSPWYPTMKLFRQKEVGDWDDVLFEVKENLERMIP